MKEKHADIGIVGGGIVGLAHAYMALRAGHKVVLFERDTLAVGASVRNFGLIWPIGQEAGPSQERAVRSRQHWIEVADKAGFWLRRNGSLHLAYHDDELSVLDEFTSRYGDDFGTTLLTPNKVAIHSLHARTHKLKGGLLSEMECTVNPREAVQRIPSWLEEQFGLFTRFGHAVNGVGTGYIDTSTERWRVQRVFVCSGADKATLFPELLGTMVKCKLQMMKGVVQTADFDLGPTLCAGLTLRHYRAFRQCASLASVDKRYDREYPRMKEFGIHVLLGHNNRHELIIGDSHEYGPTPAPFDSEEINQLILEYLQSFAELPGLRITERWHGVYAKSAEGADLVISPMDGVVLVNGLGGAGMTLSFGLAEQVMEKFGTL